MVARIASSSGFLKVFRIIDFSITSHYGRGIPIGRLVAIGLTALLILPFAAAATPTAPAPGWQFASHRFPVAFNGFGMRTNRLRIRPVVRIKTLHLRRQPVPLFRRARPSGDSFQQFPVTGA